MKKIIIGLLTLLIFSNSYGIDTLVSTIGGSGITVEALGGFRADSGFQPPMVPSTKRFTQGMKSTGQLFINIADSALYIMKNNVVYKIYSTIDTNNPSSPVTPSYVATAVSTAGGAFIPLTQKAAKSGVASLDTGGKVPLAQLSSLVIGATFVSVNTAAMLALSASVGDVCVRTDSNLTFRLQTAGATIYTHWVQLLFPQGVTTFNGRTLGVIPRRGDYTTDSVAEGANLYATVARTQAVIASDTGVAGWIANGVDVNIIKNATGKRLVGRYSSTTGRAQWIILGTGLTFDTTTGTLNSSGGTLTSVSSATDDLTATASTTNVILTVNSAPILRTARNINGISFDGSTNILLNTVMSSVSSNHTLFAAENQTLIMTTNTSPTSIAITIPNGGFTPGCKIDILQISTGSVRIAGAVGVTITSFNGFKTLAGQGVGVSLICIGLNTWALVGNLVSP